MESLDQWSRPLERFQELVKKYGTERFNHILRDLLDYSEKEDESRNSEFPDGVYRFIDRVEDDGIEDKEYEVHVAVHVQGDEVVIDYTGSSEQAKGPINATLGVAWSAAFNAMLHLTDQKQYSKNSGCFRPIRVIAPAGTVMNVNYPGSEVGGNTETHPLIVAAIFGAMVECVPDRLWLRREPLMDVLFSAAMMITLMSPSGDLILAT